MTAIRLRPDSQEAEVIKELSKCKNKIMLEKTQEFLNDFKEQGFGFVEGSKWSSFTTRDQHTQEDLYMTAAQVLKEECGDEANARAKIKYAESLGEGVNEDGKRRGWYRDETQQNAPVYYYARNMAHAVKLRDDKKHMTKQSAKTSPEDLAAHAREACMISTLQTLRIENNCPCYTDSKNNLVVGTFIDRPSGQGMAQAEFTGSAGPKQIVELPFLTYKEYKDKHAAYCKPKRKRRRRLLSLKRGKKNAGQVTKKPAAQEEPAAPQEGQEGPSTKPLRPLQYYLLKRPAGMSHLKAKKKWKAMSPEDKTQFGLDTWEERKARKL